MNQNTLRTIVTVAILILAFSLVMSILRSLISFLLPISIVVVAVYIVYRVINRPKY